LWRLASNGGAADNSSVAEDRDPTVQPPQPDRRRVPRIDVHGQIQGQLLAVEGGIAVTIHNVSRHGFLMAGSRPFYRGDVRDFRFALTVGEPVTIRGRIVRTVRFFNEREAIYTAGVEFTDPTADAERIEHLLQAIDAPASRL
jgi:PilZ domain